MNRKTRAAMKKRASDRNWKLWKNRKNRRQKSSVGLDRTPYETQRLADAAERRKQYKGKPRPFWVRKDGTVNYQAYLNSSRWKARRQVALDDAGGKCETCGSGIAVGVHHLSYKNLGNEPKEDLQVLCRGCHENAHEGEKPGVLDPMTRQFLSMSF